MSYLNEAITAIREAVEQTPAGHPNRALYLTNLGETLRRRFERTLCIDDINASVSAHEEAVELIPKGHQDLAMYLNNLGIALLDRCGPMDDMNPLMIANKEAVKLTPRDNPNRPMYLDNLGIAFQRQFDRSGLLEDINQAIVAIMEAIDLTPKHHSDRVLYLGHLGTALRRRYYKIESLEDLNAAVMANHEAVRLTPENHVLRAERLNNLSYALQIRFERIASVDDLDLATEASKEALKLTPEGVNRSLFLDNLGSVLQHQFDRNGSLEQLNSALEAFDSALKSTPEDHHAKRAMRLCCCSSVLMKRFEKTGSLDDLNASVEAGERAANLFIGDAPERGACSVNLGRVLMMRVQVTGSNQDKYSAIIAYCSCVMSEASPRVWRIYSAMQVASLLYNLNLKFGSQFLIKAVEFLPAISLYTLHQNDQQFALSSFRSLASDAAALSISDGNDIYESIRILELGRGVISSVYFELRSDIGSLKTSHPELAEKFELLRDEVSSHPVQNCSLDQERMLQFQTVRRYEASKEYDAILRTIRQQNGFKSFLLGPSGNELKSFASVGPLVFLNASYYGCEAFLITYDDIRHLSLSNVTYYDVKSKCEALLEILDNDSLKDRNRNNISMTTILEWLWDFFVEPVLNELGLTEMPGEGDTWPRIWWIPVGHLSLFPIHAAGYHSVVGRNTLDRVISSYTPTIRALDHARNQSQSLSEISSPAVLLVSMPTTPNRRSLIFANEEINAIDDFLPPSLRRMKMQNPTKSEVIEKISQCSIAHFACHGAVNSQDPSKSRILLSDWEIDPLSAADVAQTKLDRVELAYISACHTATNRDFALLDESIHIGGAFQLAGFPRVIGTLWQIGDEYSAKIAKRVYRSMLTEDGKLDVQRAASGLHFAIRKVRDELLKECKLRTSDPITWAGYIYVGV